MQRIFLFFLAITVIGCSQKISNYHIPNFPQTDGFLEIEGGKLYYQLVGKQESTTKNIPIIVIHGGPGLDQGYLLPGMAVLANNRQVIFYDQRGSGRSTASNIDEQHISIDQFVEDLETLRKSLGYDKFILVGHSWGGFLGMSYAIKYASNIDKLVIMNSIPATTNGIHSFVEEVEKRTASDSDQIENIQKSQAFIDNDPQVIAKFYALFFKHYLHNPSDISKLNLVPEAQGIASGKEVSKILQKILFTKFIDLTESLSKLQIPTLIIHGTSDVMPGTAHEISNVIAGSRLAVQKDCGHFPYVEKPKEWLAIMEDFLK